MKIYDKAQWHIDGGEKSNEVIEKFKLIMSYLKKHNMLSSDGDEIMEIGIDSSISLNERMLNESGNIFLEKNYDALLPLNNKALEEKLKEL